MTDNLMARLMPLAIVVCAVILNILSAVLLKTLADSEHISVLLLVSGLGLIVLINAARFMAWWFAHKKYPLSKTYPLSSLFFPLMLVVSYVYGDSINWQQITGALLIMAGVVWLTLRVPS